MSRVALMPVVMVAEVVVAPLEIQEILAALAIQGMQATLLQLYVKLFRAVLEETPELLELVELVETPEEMEVLVVIEVTTLHLLILHFAKVLMHKMLQTVAQVEVQEAELVVLEAKIQFFVLLFVLMLQPVLGVVVVLGYVMREVQEVKVQILITPNLAVLVEIQVAAQAAVAVSAFVQ